MKKTRLSSVASLLAVGMLMGGCMADVGAESESEGGAAQGPSVGGGEAVGEAKQALQAPLPGTWTDWQKLDLPAGVATQKSPAISSRGSGKFDVFVLGTDNNIYIKSYYPSPAAGFGPWVNLGAPKGRTFVSGPDAVSSDANSFAVVAMADNGHYYLNTWTNASGSRVMSGWKQIMGKGLTNGPGPGISSFRPGRLAVYGVGPDSRTWESRQDPQAQWGWSWPESLGSPQNAPLASSVTSVSWDSNKVDLFARGSDNSLWTRGWDGAGWKPQNDWRKLGGQFTSGFGAASWGFGHLDVFGVGADSKLYQIQYETGWSAFTRVESPSVGLAGDAAPDAVSSGPGKIDLVVRGSDNQPWVRSFNASGIRRSLLVALGDHHNLAVKSDGTLWAWGSNFSGQLGDGTTTERLSPVKGKDLMGVVGVSVGYAHSLALTRDGTVWTWGRGDFGLLGDGTTTERHTPGPVPGLTGIVAVAVAIGGDHSLALKNDGTLWAWGNNFNGQLGDGTLNDAPTPKQVLTGIVAVAAGQYHSLALKSDGTLLAWGSNFSGELGDGTRTPYRRTPEPVPGLTGVVAVSAGYSHSLALTRDGTLWAWGSNKYGQLGDGPTTASRTPKQVLTGVVAVAAGGFHNLALKSDSTLWSWGSNSNGQLGDGTMSPGIRSTPLPVNLPGGVVAMAAGYSHCLAVKSDGTVWTWGYNVAGQLGDGTKTKRSTPGQLMDLPVKF